MFLPEPDPTNADFDAIVKAIEQLIKAGQMREERTLIWVE